MGNNSSKWDPVAHYGAMSLQQLQEIKDQYEAMLATRESAALREGYEQVRLMIAERIGRPKQNPS